ncbi:MAG: lipocalin-like domain-containing protein, partial [Pseudomonadota bacterium]
MHLRILFCIRLLVCLALILTPLSVVNTTASAQGFAGLGTTADGFEKPDPDKPLAFPRDHGAHPGYRIEWWYLTANLQGADGKIYGVQWTLFRSAMRPPNKDAVQLRGWKDGQTWMAHAGLT